ncbi:MAG: SAM-dependent methyltransferase [Bacteroidota bacterium]
MSSGKLYLIPTPLGENALHTLAPYAIEQMHQLRYFIAERARTARRFLKTTQPPCSISEMTFFELDKHQEEASLVAYLDPLLQGQDMGLLSEAGCPGVADPGAQMVRLAHARSIEVVPLVGPSSLLLALMASGMNGQSFAFHGYLSSKKPELAKDLKRLEQLARKHKQTQLFIEAPYRNRQVVEQALQQLQADTHFGIAADLSLPGQYIASKRISQWRKSKLPDLHKRPAVFLIL